MSTLTKICVVVLVLLVLFASGPFIQQAVTGPDWKQACQKQTRKAELAEASARSNMLKAQVYQRLFENAQIKAVASEQRSIGTIEGKDVEIARLTGQLAKRSGEVTELTTFNKNFRLNLEEQIKTNKNLLTLLEAKRGENIVLNNQLLSAQHTINKQQTDLEISDRSVRSLQEQLVQRNAEIDELRDQTPAGGAKVATVEPVVKGPKINGSITAVRGDLASLSVGSASGVKKGMEFTIYRGENLVAFLRIANVDVAESTGIITDRTRDPKVGDKASNNLE